MKWVRARAWLAATGMLAVACAPDAPSRGGAERDMDAAVAAPYVLPTHAPGRFGFGAEASPARVALWDIDVKPDGEGLPAGRGSVAEGRQVYLTHCVACHGPTGTEGPNDRLVGTEPWGDWPGSLTVGGYWPYATTLYDYIRKAMPQLTPGILTADQTYAVIAHILNLNGIVADDAVMDAESLPAVRMPSRDRFVMDDREGGAGTVR
jgi:cytochrome c